MPHPHSEEAMNNYDNHGTMASFINARGVQTWGWLGCLSIFCNQDLFLGSKTSMSAEWCHRWVSSCPSFCCLSFFLSLFIFFYLSLTHKERNKCLWKCDWEWKWLAQCQKQWFNNPSTSETFLTAFIMKFFSLYTHPSTGFLCLW